MHPLSTPLNGDEAFLASVHVYMEIVFLGPGLVNCEYRDS